MYTSDLYEDFINRLLKKTPYIRTKALGRAIFNKFGNISWEYVRSVLQMQQDKGNVVLTEDGYALSKGMLVKLIGQFPKFNFGAPCRYGSIEHVKDKMDRDLLDCLWIVADMMPYSENFCLASSPFSLCFDVPAQDDKPARFYQVVNIPENVEDVRIEMIRNYALILPKAEVRYSYRRIAIIHNEQHCWKVPYLGFSAICILDEKEKSGYRVLETRTENLWKDAIE